MRLILIMIFLAASFGQNVQAAEKLEYEWFVADPFREVRVYGSREAAVARAKAALKYYQPTEPNEFRDEVKALNALLDEVWGFYKKTWPVMMSNKEKPLLFLSKFNDSNAFAMQLDDETPVVVFTLSLFKKSDKDTLRNTMAHELAHVLLGHSHGDPIIFVKSKSGARYVRGTQPYINFAKLFEVGTYLGITGPDWFSVYSSSTLSRYLLEFIRRSPTQACRDLEVSIHRINYGVETLALNPYTYTVEADVGTRKTFYSYVEDTYQEINKLCTENLGPTDDMNKDLNALKNSLQKYMWGYVDWRLTFPQLVKRTMQVYHRRVAETIKQLGYQSFREVNFYTVEDQADELAAITLSKSNIKIDYTQVYKERTGGEHSFLACESLIKQKKEPWRSGDWVTTHRTICSRLYRDLYINPKQKTYHGLR